MAGTETHVADPSHMLCMCAISDLGEELKEKLKELEADARAGWHHDDDEDERTTA